MIYWCTKYALSEGIIEFDGTRDDDGYVSETRMVGYNKLFLKLNRDAFDSREDAEKRALKMAMAKRQSLTKAIKENQECIYWMNRGTFKIGKSRVVSDDE